MNREMAEIVRNQQPLTMRPSATVQGACKAMHERRVGAVLITNLTVNWSASSLVGTQCDCWGKGRVRATRISIKS